MLPRIAMPRAPPNSAPVSEIPEAAPARSGGALPTMTSVAREPTGATPSVRMTEPITRTASPQDVSAWVSIPKPTAESVRPPAITKAGRTRRAISGASRDPAISPPDEGTVHRPATSGESPKHQLQVLGDEEKDPGDHEDAERERGQRRAEGGHPEEPKVDQRVGQRSLPAHEHDGDGEPRHDGEHRQPSYAILSHLLEAVDRSQHGDQRHRRADQVQSSRLGIAELR